MRPMTLLLLCLALAACGSEPGATVAAADRTTAPGAGLPPAETESTAPAAGNLGEFRIVSVLLGNRLDEDALVASDGDLFDSKDAIHASVLSAGAHQGLRLSARWLAPDGSTIAETTQPMVPTAATAATFTVRHPQGWPTGNYQVEIGVNGRTLHTRDFQIR